MPKQDRRQRVGTQDETTRTKWLRATHQAETLELGQASVRSFQQERHARGERARSILDGAHADGRELTPSEERDFDQAMDDVDELKALIGGEEAARDRARSDFAGTTDRAGEAGFRFRLADGREIPGVRHGESFAAALGHERRSLPVVGGNDGGGSLDLGRSIMAVINGEQPIIESAQRAQSISNDPSGGYLTSPQMSSLFIDLARSRSIMSAAGAITVPLNGPETRILRVTQDPVAAFKAELAQLTETDMKFGLVVLYPKTLGAVITVSEELAADGQNAGRIIQETLAQSVANQLDRAFFRGIGTIEGQEFSGVLDDPDVNVVDLSGAAPTSFDEVVDAIQLVRDANGEPVVRIDSPRTAGQYAKLADTTGQPLQPPAEVAALRHLVSTQTPVDLGTGSDESVSVVGNFGSAFVMLGIRSSFRVEVSPYAGDAFETFARKVRIVGRVDLAIGRPSHLSLVENIGV
ncbi:phage major capsid protein [Glycomyces sp. L485]|uniref:phage major capsid protein n=1 Tax=Glycomyces sp. L485 TaxID=2909235 RepID=UPI001F4ABBB4|nr:phage major capsid protein [Glycomyces sp. L485]MCH7229600.1 phage major capsid protein [Glycomyces sp. L485]